MLVVQESLCCKYSRSCAIIMDGMVMDMQLVALAGKIIRGYRGTGKPQWGMGCGGSVLLALGFYAAARWFV